MVFLPGQRVINEAEPTLGLGQVAHTDRRTITVDFPAVEESRVYSLQTAPLRRMVLSVGQTATDRQGTTFRVEKVEERENLLIYSGEGHHLSELELSDEPPATGALDHLRACQLAPLGDYRLRRRAWELRSQRLRSPVAGLVGPRVDLLEHQLYVADKVLSMARPRVLLADEVGLGKTIEAGLIFSGLARAGRAERVLALVPQPLVHQWLAEFFRRFNLMFEIFKPEEPDQVRVLCPDTEMEELPEREWDLVIVDEAHHHFDHPVVERLSRSTRGLLLLTATPSRLGVESLFGLLRLVDPDRFSDLIEFVTEQKHLKTVSRLALAIEEGRLEQVAEPLTEHFPADPELGALLYQGRREELLEALCDRHGTGRVLVRNRRHRLGHLFPGRRLEAVAVEDKLSWLRQFLLNHDRKVLVITHSPDEVVELYEALRRELPTPLATFHERMSLLERDRQAAYFAEPQGARVLLASEIGSEGRNFQFASDLVLYDLPVHPDLLEQRIGRLDRIGQQNEVVLHVPYRRGGREEAVLGWHREGLDSFARPVAGGDRLYQRFGKDVESLDLEVVGQAAAEERTRAEDNEDVLIDRNSFDSKRGEELAHYVRQQDQDRTVRETLPELLERYGVLMEELDRGIFSVKAGDMMFVDSLPGMPEGGFTGTFDRLKGLQREDLEFFSSEHPLVEGALELLLDQADSRAEAVRWRQAPETTVLLAFLYVVQAVGPADLELARFLPPQTVEVHLDMKGQRRPELGQALGQAMLEKLAPEVAATLVGRLGETLEPLSEKAQEAVTEAFAPLLERAHREAGELLAKECERSAALARVNPSVTQKDLAILLERRREILSRLQEASPRLDAIQLVLLQEG